MVTLAGRAEILMAQSYPAAIGRAKRCRCAFALSLVNTAPVHREQGEGLAGRDRLLDRDGLIGSMGKTQVAWSVHDARNALLLVPGRIAHACKAVAGRWTLE